MKPPPGLSGAERLKWYKDKKKEKIRKKVQKCRQKSKHADKVYNPRYLAAKELKEIENLKTAKVREQTKIRVRAHRQQRKVEAQNSLHRVCQNVDDFSNRMQKCRAIKCVKDELNHLNPSKRCKVINSLLDCKSPKSIKTRELLEESNTVVSKKQAVKQNIAIALLDDVKKGFSVLKSTSKTCQEKTAASICFGASIEKGRYQKKLATETGLSRNLIRKSIRRNKKLVNNEEEAWKCTIRKTRKDCLPEDARKKVFEFWKENSQPVNDKRKMVRERIGPKIYAQHPKHITTRTQTEIFLDFKQKYPDISIQQRMFEKLRPFYIKPARRKDRITCLCRQHQELNLLFRSAKKYRRNLVDKKLIDSDYFPVWNRLSDLVDETLCQKVEFNGQQMNKLPCIERNCSNCGVNYIKLSALEKDENNDCCFETVKWQRYEYFNIGKKGKNGKEIKKQKLVTVVSAPGEMWHYIKEKLSAYPLHQFQANWQRQQLHQISSKLPHGQVLLIHDYSEDFKCEVQDEIQSEYFAKNEVAIHVSVLYRHAVLEVDGIDSTEEEPDIRKEYIFTIFENNSHDNDSIHHVRKVVVNDYLKEELNYNVRFIHEFTDGCSQQYKSRYCMGDISFSQPDFDNITQRNYFESSHGKGEQDAAGSHVKNKAIMSVVRRECEIKNAYDLFQYLNKTFTNPAPSTFQSRQNEVKLNRRIFFYVPSNTIETGRISQNAKPIQENRKLHCIRGIDGAPGELLVRKRTCYCDMCIDELYDECLYAPLIGKWEKRKSLDPISDCLFNQSEDTESDTSIFLSTLAKTGDIIVIEPRTESCDYMLAMVKSDGYEILSGKITDSFGKEYFPGEFVLKCNPFFEQSIFHFCLDESKHVMVGVAEIKQFVDDEMREGSNKDFRISLDTHEEIMESM